MSLWSRISNAMHGERLNREIEEELQAHMEEAMPQDAIPGKRAVHSAPRCVYARRATAFALPDGLSLFSRI